MTAPNHIVGGIAITGISLSFWDINIFSNSLYLSLCIFSALLPDIDHTKSTLGKVFFPIAKYIDTRYGHRTITHSLTFLIPLFIFFLFIELNLINPIYDRNGVDFSLIFLFAYISHLILDMLTIQGIPLFFPFMKNPCVIPANPTLRFRSGNIKSEAIALFIFTFVLISSYDLFKNGFWTTYNRSFGTVKHAYREFKESDKIISVTCEYTFNGDSKFEAGYIVDASETHLEIWIDDNVDERLLRIDTKDNRIKNIVVKPSKTIYKYSITDLSFFNLTIEQLNDTLDNKIVSGKIISSNKFIVNNTLAERGSIKLDKSISPKFKWIENNTLKDDLKKKIKLKKIKLEDIERYNLEEKNKLQNSKNLLLQLEMNLRNSKDLYEKNKFEKLIILQKKKINNFDLNLKSSTQIEMEIYFLKKELDYNEKHFFTGDLKIYYVPRNDEDFLLAEKK